MKTKYIIKTIFILSITALFMKLSYMTRGYFAIGGEVLVVPAYYIVKWLVPTFIEVMEWN